jgi:hypothetical protein
MDKAKLLEASLGRSIVELVKKSDHRVLAVWAADCAERVLPYFESRFPEDARPRKAIEAGREWARTGIFRMADVRGASLAAHVAAREADDDSAPRFAARAAGQAVATAHVATHSLGAAWYAVKAVRAADPQDAEVNVAKELDWECRRLLELVNAPDRRTAPEAPSAIRCRRSRS